jgi:hypothetical protein
MSQVFPGPLQVVLLFDEVSKLQTAQFDWPAFLQAANNGMADIPGLPPITELMQNEPGKFALISNKTFHVTISLNDTPISLDGFARPFVSPFYANMQPELLEHVKAHKAHILIEIGLGNIPFPVDNPLLAELGMAKELGFDEDQAKFEMRLAMTKAIAALVNKMAPGGVVHWGQSDTLLTSENFAKAAQSDFPANLYVHPFFHSSGATKGGETMAGVNGIGSQFLVGKPVVFAEHEQPMIESYQRMLEFIVYCRQIGRVLQDGESFGRDASEQIIVHHRGPTDAIPANHIELELTDPDNPHRAPRVTAPASDAPNKPKVRLSLAAESTALRDAFLGRDDPTDEKTSKETAKSGFLSGMLGKMAARKPSAPKAKPDAVTNVWEQRLKLGKLVFAGLAIIYVMTELPEITKGMAEITSIQAELEQMQQSNPAGAERF